MEKPDWSVEKSFLSVRDIGRMLLREAREWLEKFDDDNCDLLNEEETN